MQCYYEVLGVERDASEGDIRKAYKKMALKWHPDKNMDRLEEATEHFKKVQLAFDTLSDPHERVWYDNHRESILKGGDGTKDAEEHSVNLWPYFSSSCYKGFGDEPGGFYATYDKLFSELDVEEQKSYSIGSKIPIAPRFGNSQTPWEEVDKFYQEWSVFSSVKSFGWLEQYNLSEAESRRVRRLMEQENKKIRDAGKREYNEQIRHLVATIKKKDPRFKKYMDEMIRIKEEKAREREEREEQRKIEAMKQREQWRAEQEAEELEMQEKLRSAGLLVEEVDSDDESNIQVDDEGMPDEFYCIVCRKNFRSQKQWSNHEKSKKHRDSMSRLKTSVSFTPETEETLSAAVSDLSLDPSSPASSSEAPDSQSNVESLEVEEEEEEDFTPSTPVRQKGKNKKKGSASSQVPVAEPEKSTKREGNDEEDEEDEKDAFPSLARNKKARKKALKKMKKRNQNSFVLHDDVDEEEEEEKGDQETEKEDQEKSESTPQEEGDQTKVDPFASDDLNSPASLAEDDQTGPQKKKKRRRANKAPAGPVPVAQVSSWGAAKPVPKGKAAKDEDDGDVDNGTVHVCRRCSASYPTRNKLFQHVKQTGHEQVTVTPKKQSAAQALDSDEEDNPSKRGKKRPKKR